MKKRAFVIQVSGKRYQSFIADYIYFCFKSYPNVDVIVLYDSNLSKKTILALEFLKSLGSNFRLEKVNFSNLLYMDNSLYRKLLYKRNLSFRQCGRFLLEHVSFRNYDEIYIGDADILIVPEENNLFDMHNKHAQYINMPYSDILRPIIKKQNHGFLFSFKKFLRFGPVYFQSRKRQPLDFEVNEMTGLRYIEVGRYFEKVRPHFETYRKMIGGLFRKNDRYQKYTISTFSDQQILYSLMMSSFGCVPKRSVCDGIDEKNPYSFSYRPHHGIHLKLFLRNKNIPAFSRILNCTSYKAYLKSFAQIINQDDYKKISEFRFGYCKKEVRNLLRYLVDKKKY